MLNCIPHNTGLPRNAFGLTNLATVLLLQGTDGKTRKNGVTPEWTHPLTVQRLLAQTGVDDPQVHCAALLHDVLEDNAGHQRDQLATAIELHLGQPVLKLVQTLTDDTTQPHPERKARQLTKYRHAPWQVKVVKLADLVAAAQEGPAPMWTAAKRKSYREHRILLVAHALTGVCSQLEQAFHLAMAKPVWTAMVAGQQGGAS